MSKAGKKSPRDVSKLSGKPLSETLQPSPVLQTASEPWMTSQDLTEDGLPFVPEVVHGMTFFLLANPNMNSSLLFRADILFDSQDTASSTLPLGVEEASSATEGGNAVSPLPAREVAGFSLTRTVVRRLIPRKQNIDRPLDQTCHFYESNDPDPSVKGNNTSSGRRRFLAIYTPHVTSKEHMPYYHPVVGSLAFLYDFNNRSTVDAPDGTGAMSVHVLLYPDEPVHDRLERTLHILLNVQIRISRGTRLTESLEVANHNPIKDNVIPQRLLQDTYSRLKSKYGSYLCNNWVESTHPSKHVFEDLAVTAFLIELWRGMYGCIPADERTQTASNSSKFPGFVDVACGNGVLVFVLLQEGYQGWGFDARRRKTWSIFPESVQERLKEEIYIPKPFADELISSLGGGTKEVHGELELNIGVDVKIHTGTFPKGTFIISNHADELTLWTPIMASLLNPGCPSPFLAIPCCSHSLSGARYRYPPPTQLTADKEDTPEPNHQPPTGDLKALRKEKQDSRTDAAGFSKSMYGSLTAKTVSISEELGYEVEKTLLRIPSTRNMGIIGGRLRTTKLHNPPPLTKSPSSLQSAPLNNNHNTIQNNESALERTLEIVQRECLREGGIRLAAKTWIERAKTLHQGQGSGNQHGAHSSRSPTDGPTDPDGHLLGLNDE